MAKNETQEVVARVVDMAAQGTLGYRDLSTVAKMLVKARNYEVAVYLYRAWLNNTQSPVSCVVYADLGDTLVAAKDIEGAREAFLSALKLNETFARARNALEKLDG